MVKFCLALARDYASMTQEGFRWWTGRKWRVLCASELEVKGDDHKGDEQDMGGIG